MIIYPKKLKIKNVVGESVTISTNVPVSNYLVKLRVTYSDIHNADMYFENEVAHLKNNFKPADYENKLCFITKLPLITKIVDEEC